MTRALGLAALAAVLAGCGGGRSDALPRDLASRLAARSTAVAVALQHGDQCGADRDASGLRASVEAAIRSGRVPAELQAPLRLRVRRLASAVTCPPPPPVTPVVTKEHGKEKKPKKPEHHKKD